MQLEAKLPSSNLQLSNQSCSLCWQPGPSEYLSEVTEIATTGTGNITQTFNRVGVQWLPLQPGLPGQASRNFFMAKFNCNQCNRDFNTYKGFQSHRSKTHKISGAETYVDIHYNGEWPVCQCGCNERLNYFSTFGLGKYLKGHAAKINGGFYSKEGADKSAETRRAQ